MTDWTQYPWLRPPQGWRIGIDGRYWDGVIPTDFPTPAFIGLKATGFDIAGDHLSRDFPLQWAAAKRLGIPPLPFHWFTYRSNAFDAAEHGRLQAEVFIDAIKAVGAKAPMAVAIDVEDKPSLKGVRAVTALRACLLFVQAAGFHPVIYSARWFWTDYLTPYALYYHPTWSPYQYDLWQADPPPDDPPFGWPPAGQVIRQYYLDWSAPGFHAKIDVNWVRQTWVDRWLVANPEPVPAPAPPPHDDCAAQLSGIQEWYARLRDVVDKPPPGLS